RLRRQDARSDRSRPHEAQGGGRREGPGGGKRDSGRALATSLGTAEVRVQRDAKEQGMRVTLETVAKAIDGEAIGDPTIEITGVAGIREAQEGDLTFLANPRYEGYLEATRASAVIVAENHRATEKALIRNPNPYLAFLKAVCFFQGDAPRPEPGLHPTAV